ncbi:MAG: histidinol dehydrogenase [bacterium]|nr:histidinol dehydrogenase [bacterium]
MELIKIKTINDWKNVCGTFRQKNKDTKKEESIVRKILNDVQDQGDKALVLYSRKFDHPKFSVRSIKLGHKEISQAKKNVPQDFIKTLENAVKNITEFHREEKRRILSWEKKKKDSFVGQRVIPIEKIGVYVPGGRAPLCSTVLMNVIPAKIAGADKIILCTPFGKDGKINPYILLAADLLGIKDVYCLGGAQAIGAMAYGTETVPKVDKIVGPGNIYVALAKKMVFGNVGIDSFAGPSEVLIIADDSADPRFVAADLLSQAEHDPDAQSVLITNSLLLAKSVKKEINIQKEFLSRKSIIDVSLKKNGMVIVVEDLDQAIELSNLKAPEHLELMVKNPSDLLKKVKNAGAVFLGAYTPESVGDYWAGPNHVLPTGGTARFSSSLSVYDFIKRTNYMSYSKKALDKINIEVSKIAEVEGLTAHANSVKIR